jgi:hypothetical protein
MVAGGTGLAPLRAVLEQIGRDWAATGSGPRVQLFHGSRTAWNLYDDHYLTRLASKPWFTYTPVVSEDPTYPAPGGLSVPWLPRPAIGLTGQPWSAARREWSGTRCRNSGLSAFLPRRSAASSSTFFEAPS